jgi:hypothetical protein
MCARRPTPRRSERHRDVTFMLRVKLLPCAARELGGCSGVIEADHAGRRPLGRKCNDDECVPLCQLHHRQRTDFSGPFKHWTRQEMREFLDLAISETQTVLLVAVPTMEGVE